MKKIIFLFCILQSLTSLYSQTIVWDKTFRKSGYDQFSCLLPTTDGGCLVAANAFMVFFKPNKDLAPGSRGNDIYLVKLNKRGEVEWEKSFGGSFWDQVEDIQSTADGGYILGGFTESTDGNIQSGNKGGTDGWVLKLNVQGEIEWERTYGGSKDECIYSIMATDDGGYIFAGSTMSADGDIRSGNKGEKDIWVVKLDAKGKIDWEKTYGGRSMEERPIRICKVTDGYILGSSTQSTDGDVKSGNKGKEDIWLLKIDNKGKLKWEKTFGGSHNDSFSDFKLTKDGGYIVVGYTQSSDGDVHSAFKGRIDGWMLKLDNRGKIQWEKCFGGKSADFFDKVCVTDSGFVVGGRTCSNEGDIKNKKEQDYAYWILKLDAKGNLLTEKGFEQPEPGRWCVLHDLQPCNGGGFLLGGDYNDSETVICKSKNWVLKVMY